MIRRETDARALARALQLVAITDNLRDGIEGLVSRAAAAERGGATMIQIRLKDADARIVADVTRRVIAAVAVPVLVNDRVDIALAAGAAGVHVGADDLPAAAVRAITAPGFIIGTSLGAPDEATNALHADYVGIGPISVTQSKTDAGSAIGTDGFATLRAMTSLPAVGIGGISVGNARAVIHAGANGIAVIASVFGATDPEQAARALIEAMR